MVTFIAGQEIFPSSIGGPMIGAIFIRAGADSQGGPDPPAGVAGEARRFDKMVIANWDGGPQVAHRLLPHAVFEHGHTRVAAGVQRGGAGLVVAVPVLAP